MLNTPLRNGIPPYLTKFINISSSPEPQQERKQRQGNDIVSADTSAVTLYIMASMDCYHVLLHQMFFISICKYFSLTEYRIVQIPLPNL